MQEYKTDIENLDLKLKPVFVYRDRIIYPKEIVK
jgi:hypothetical protein